MTASTEQTCPEFEAAWAEFEALHESDPFPMGARSNKERALYWWLQAASRQEYGTNSKAEFVIEVRNLKRKISELEAELQAARRAPVVPQGWREVAELCAQMCENRASSLVKSGQLTAACEASKCASVLRNPPDYWHAMLAAAPQPPEAERVQPQDLPEGPWSYRPNEYDDWGIVKDACGAVVCQARDTRVLSDEALAAHRRAGTDPWKNVARFIVDSRNAMLATCNPSMQPTDNVAAWRFGEACSSAKPGGDYIDRGLSLLQQLEKKGYGIAELKK